MSRKSIPPSTELSVLQRSRRRCALCWGFEHDLAVKRVQIAHVDHDASNTDENNLVALCQTHHDDYDTIPRQTRRLTPAELLRYRDELYDLLDKRKRVVVSEFVEPDGSREKSTTDAQRLGLIVDAFDEDLMREKPNGLGLSALAQRFVEVDGDFPAAREAIMSLLRLIQREPVDRATGAIVFLLGQNGLPMASPLVSLARALLHAASVDGMHFVALVDMATNWAVHGERRSFAGRSITDAPQANAALVAACLLGIGRGAVGPCDEWVQDTAVKRLAHLVSQITIVYALQGYEFPEMIERIYQGHHGRAAPGPGFIGPDGPIEDYERGKCPPDIWFTAMNMVARLSKTHFERAIAEIPSTLFDWESLFDVADNGEARAVEDAKNMADLWTTEWHGSIVSGRIHVRTERELAEVVAHVRQRKTTAERALANLRRCLHDERRLLFRKLSEE